MFPEDKLAAISCMQCTHVLQRLDGNDDVDIDRTGVCVSFRGEEFGSRTFAAVIAIIPLGSCVK